MRWCTTGSQILRDLSVKFEDSASFFISTSAELLDLSRNGLFDELEALLLLQVVYSILLLNVRLQADQVLSLFKFRGKVGLLLPKSINFRFQLLFRVPIALFRRLLQKG